MGPIPPMAGRADYDPPRPDAEECSPSSGTLVPHGVGGAAFPWDDHCGGGWEPNPAPQIHSRSPYPMGHARAELLHGFEPRAAACKADPLPLRNRGKRWCGVPPHPGLIREV